MFPEQGKEIACDFGNLPVLYPGELFVGIDLCQVFEREYKKNFEKLNVINASTMYPISYFGRSF